MKITRLFFIIFFASAAVCSGQGTLNDGLVAFYRMEESGQDSSGNGNHGTFNGNPDFVPGRVGTAVAFDGVDDYLKVDSDFGTATPFSWSGWFYLYSGVEYRGAILMGIQSPPTRWQPTFSIDQDNLLRFGWANWIATPNPLPEDEWVQITGTTSANGSARIFLNGEIVAQGTNLIEGENNSYFIVGGKEPNMKLSSFRADNIRIYNRELSIDEAAELYLVDPSDDGATRAAQGVAEIVNGFIVGISLVDGGAGYEEPPVVLVQSTQGFGAEVVAVIEDGRVVEFVVSNPGSGYLEEETHIVVAAPPEAPSLEIRVTEVTVTMHVTVGRQYQLQSSTDAQNWQNEGELFVAESPTYEQAFSVGEIKRFFRIIEVTL